METPAVICGLPVTVTSVPDQTQNMQPGQGVKYCIIFILTLSWPMPN